MRVRVNPRRRKLPWPAVGVGVVAGGVTVLAPRALGANVTVNQAYLVQAGVGVAGALVLALAGAPGEWTLFWLGGAAAIIAGDVVGHALLGLEATPQSSFARQW